MKKHILKPLFELLDDKINDCCCENCPYLKSELNYYEGDYTVWCDVTGSMDGDCGWYCIMPNFIKELVRKWFIHKTCKCWEKYANEHLIDKDEVW